MEHATKNTINLMLQSNTLRVQTKNITRRQSHQRITMAPNLRRGNIRIDYSRLHESGTKAKINKVIQNITDDHGYTLKPQAVTNVVENIVPALGSIAQRVAETDGRSGSRSNLCPHELKQTSQSQDQLLKKLKSQTLVTSPSLTVTTHINPASPITNITIESNDTFTEKPLSKETETLLPENIFGLDIMNWSEDPEISAHVESLQELLGLAAELNISVEDLNINDPLPQITNDLMKTPPSDSQIDYTERRIQEIQNKPPVKRRLSEEQSKPKKPRLNNDAPTVLNSTRSQPSKPKQKVVLC